MAVQNPSQGIIITANDTQNGGVKAVTTSMPYANYLKFYNINNSKVRIAFKKMSEEDEKNYLRNLTKEEKQNYKYTKKIQQIIDKGAWGEVLYKLLINYSNDFSMV